MSPWIRRTGVALAALLLVLIGAAAWLVTSFDANRHKGVAVADGVARSSDLDMKSPFLRLGGDGAIDIGRGMIDYTARATVTATGQGQDGADLAALKGLTVPVHLSGPFDAIDWRIRWSAVAVNLLTNPLERVLDGLKPPAASASAPAAPPKDRPKDLKDALKGLFK